MTKLISDISNTEKVYHLYEDSYVRVIVGYTSKAVGVIKVAVTDVDEYNNIVLDENGMETTIPFYHIINKDINLATFIGGKVHEAIEHMIIFHESINTWNDRVWSGEVHKMIDG